MLLSEEYRNRHNIRCPLVKFDDYMSLIFTADQKIWGSRWVIFEIKKNTKNERAPYPYDLSFLEPVSDLSGPQSGLNYNSLGVNPSMKQVTNKQVTFDALEVEIMNFAKASNGLTPIYNLAEAKIAAWEMFFFCNQSKLFCNHASDLSRIPLRLEETLFATIESESIEVRTKAIEKIVLEGLPRTSLNGRWETFKNYSNPMTYADWFGKIIQEVRVNEKYFTTYSDIRNLA